MIYIKIMVISDMGVHLLQILTLQMKQLAAAGAFQMIVLNTRVVPFYILITCALSLFYKISAHVPPGNKLVQEAIYRCLAYLGLLSVQFQQNFVGCDMAVFIFYQAFQNPVLLSCSI